MKKKFIITLSIIASTSFFLCGCAKYTQEDMDVLELENSQLQNSYDSLHDMYTELKAQNEDLVAQIDALQSELDSRAASVSADCIDNDLLAYYVSILSTINDYLNANLSASEAYDQISAPFADLFLMDKSNMNPVEKDYYDKLITLYAALKYIVDEDFSVYDLDSLNLAISSIYSELSGGLGI